MELQHSRRRLAATTAFLIGVVVALAILILVLVLGTPIAVAPDLLGRGRMAHVSAALARQQEVVYGGDDVWAPISETMDEIGDATTANTEEAVETAQGGLDLVMQWIGSFVDGFTLLLLLISVAIAIGTAINIVEENYLVAGILAAVLSGAAILGVAGAYYQLLGGMFLQVALMGGMFAFFLFEGYGKTGFFACFFVINPGIVILAWIYPDVFLLGGWADWHIMADAVSAWTGA